MSLKGANECEFMNPKELTPSLRQVKSIRHTPAHGGISDPLEAALKIFAFMAHTKTNLCRREMLEVCVRLTHPCCSCRSEMHCVSFCTVFDVIHICVSFQHTGEH